MPANKGSHVSGSSNLPHFVGPARLAASLLASLVAAFSCSSSTVSSVHHSEAVDITELRCCSCLIVPGTETTEYRFTLALAAVILVEQKVAAALRPERPQAT